MAKFNCSGCKKIFNVNIENVNKRILCPNCKTQLIPSVPELTSEIAPDLPNLPAEKGSGYSAKKNNISSKNAAPRKKSKTGIVIFFLIGFLGGGIILAFGSWYFLINKNNLKIAEKSEAGKSKEKVKKFDISTLSFKARSPDQVYKELLPSTAWIITNRGAGSGSLVHGDMRLVLTNYHVIDTDPFPLVFFPEGNGDSLLSDPLLYLQKKNLKGLKSRVVYVDPSKDLALLRLDQVPPGAIPVALAKKSTPVGSKLFSIGASGANFDFNSIKGTLWRLTTGDVRQVYSHDFKYRNGQAVNAKIVETQSPVNPGDSGGPLVNDLVELVGVVSGFSSKDRSVSLNVDISEVRTFLDRYFHLQGMEWVDVRPSTPLLGQENDFAKNPSYWLEVLQDGDDIQVEAAKGMLVQFGSKALPELREALKDPKKNVRLSGLDCIALIGPKASEMVSELVELFSDSDADIKISAIRTLGAMGANARTAVPSLIQLLTDSNNKVREIAVATLGRFLPFNEKDLPTFSNLLNHEEDLLREFAIRSIGEMKIAPEEIYKSVQPRYQDKSSSVRVVAINASKNLAKAYRDKILQDVFKLAADDSDQVRLAVSNLFKDMAPFTAKDLEPFVQYLGPQGDQKFRVQALKMVTNSDADLAPYTDGFVYALNDKDRDVRLSVLGALGKLAGTQPLKVGSSVLPLIADEDVVIKDASLKIIDGLDIGSSGDLQKFAEFLKNGNKIQIRIKTLEVLIKSKNLNWDPIAKDLATCLSDKEVELKKLALKAVILASGTAREVAPEVVNLTKENDETIKLEAFKALAVIGREPSALGVLFDGLADKNPKIHEVCSNGLRNLKPPISPTDSELLKKPLAAMSKEGKLFALKLISAFGKDAKVLAKEAGENIKDVDNDVKLASMEVLANCGVNAQEFLPAIVEFAKADNSPTSVQLQLRKQAFETLFRLGSNCSPVVAMIGEMVESRDLVVGDSALKVLGTMGKEAAPALPKMMLAFNNRTLLPLAAEQISKIGVDAVKPLIKGLESISPEVRLGCVLALGRIGPDAKEAAPGLAKLAFQDKVPLIRTEAKAAQLRVQSGIK